MQPIKTGSTLERIIRHGIFTGMVVIFSAYFFYDGYIGYPNANLRQTKAKLPADIQDKATINPKAIEETVAGFKIGDPISEIEDRLGPPLWRGKVPADIGQGFEEAIWLGPGGTFPVRIDRFGKVRLMPVRKVKNAQGEEQDVTTISPAEHTELDLKMQKVLGAVTGVLGLYLIFHMISILTRGATLSDEGLKHSGYPLIPFDSMTEWDVADYQKKGQIRLGYSVDETEGVVILDDYKLKAFPDIVGEICERKGFDNPIRPKDGPLASSQQDDEDEAGQA